MGDIETSKADLPSGPAIRVRSKRIGDPDRAGQGTLTEGVTYAIRPAGFDSAVVTAVTWTALHLGDRLAEMADAIVKTVTITPG